mgnify:CR=1 FL=1
MTGNHIAVGAPGAVMPPASDAASASGGVSYHGSEAAASCGAVQPADWVFRVGSFNFGYEQSMMNGNPTTVNKHVKTSAEVSSTIAIL